jgi:SRSO17 transposase
LQQLRQAVADGVPPGVALMDPAYGNSKLRAGISELALAYVAGILPTTMVWRPDEAPLPPAPRSGRGRPATRLRRDETHRPVLAPRSGTCRRCLATDHVAGRQQHATDLAVRPLAGSSGAR